jgi:DNA polymerase III delta prime subunit
MGPAKDLFGIQRERRIIESGVREAFTPHKPISDVSFLYGREQEIRRLLEYINTPGQHALLYGERGVGKSSLANVSAVLYWAFSLAQSKKPITLKSLLSREKIFLKRCDSSDRFETIVLKPLTAVGADIVPTGITRQRKFGGTGRLKAPGLEAGADASREVIETFKKDVSLSPAVVADALSELEGLLLIDELDAIKDPQDKRKLAELIKHLSDSGSPLKVLLVGIAETGTQLTAAHPSVHRCLKETRVPRMSDDELRKIIEGGAAKVKLAFEQDVIDSIVRISSGYPHFTHLLCLKCAEDAIATSRRMIRRRQLEDSMRRAVDDAEGTLKSSYHDAIRSNTKMYQIILVSAASLGTEFTARDLREAIKARTGDSISQGALNNYL